MFAKTGPKGDPMPTPSVCLYIIIIVEWKLHTRHDHQHKFYELCFIQIWGSDRPVMV